MKKILIYIAALLFIMTYETGSAARSPVLHELRLPAVHSPGGSGKGGLRPVSEAVRAEAAVAQRYPIQAKEILLENRVEPQAA